MTSPAQVQLNNSVLTVSGTVSPQTVVALRTQGETLINSAGKELTVDLAGLQTAHSVVLSMLLCWQRLARQRGITLSYRAASDSLASLAALSNVGDQLSGFDSEPRQPLH